jgi:aerobic C4-dicarboxylate transport protein
LRKIFSNLTFWVLTAITVGALFGHFMPDAAVKMRILGTGFIEIIKVFIYPIIFLTISLGISGMSNLKKVGRVGGKAILYFEVVTTLALLIGIIASYVIEPGAGVATPDVKAQDVSQYTQQATDFSWSQFLKDNVTIQVLLFSIIFGVVLSKLRARAKIIHVLSNLSKYVFAALHFVMYLAPVGAFGGMAYTIGMYGGEVDGNGLHYHGVVCIRGVVFYSKVLSCEPLEISEVYPGRAADRSRHFFIGSGPSLVDGKA